ncbi:DNA-binding transcriptional LysR family regulator [Paraburkholderia sp. BL6665CI2N2]|uniref:LysR family transcriptional regulator n=1 Tax=Paraburkholderia sp. BL6665CI2N2 TaxID=1938806 RepID=UPI001066635A|nr:LysR family transcriptional regulator [Paraburkholderia sp. BL6665CI2N2]TDY15550.1 DNA-binding transcriptional LysR family regulator [Paraburkholderia sp. BL6665CI2N2]
MTTVIPDLRLLRVFMSVVQQQGFARAQHELNMSTSAISTYMSQLEAQLGVVLCHRGRGGFSLTPKGAEFHVEAQRLLGEVDGFERFAADLKGDLRGNLRIGMLDGIVTDTNLPLDATIAAFSAARPAVHLHLLLGGSNELQVHVLNNRLDAAISTVQLKMNGLKYNPIYRERHNLYCADKHPLFNVRRVSEGDLESHRFVGRASWNRAIHMRHGMRDTQATANSVEGQLILILSGAYIGFLPVHFAQRWVDDGRLRALAPGTMRFDLTFAFIERQSRSNEPLTKEFLELLRQRIGSEA